VCKCVYLFLFVFAFLYNQIYVDQFSIITCNHPTPSWPLWPQLTDHRLWKALFFKAITKNFWVGLLGHGRICSYRTCGWLVHDKLTPTMVTYGTRREAKSVSCPHRVPSILHGAPLGWWCLFTLHGSFMEAFHGQRLVPFNSAWKLHGGIPWPEIGSTQLCMEASWRHHFMETLCDSYGSFMGTCFWKSIVPW